MSRILRRPMFRGGRVPSYGTGIASGLADGGRVNYAGGGQIGGGIIYGKPMADGRYGFADVTTWEDLISGKFNASSGLSGGVIPSSSYLTSDKKGGEVVADAMAMHETDGVEKIDEVETVEKSEEFQPKSFEDVQAHTKVQMEGTPKTLEEIDELVANYGTGKENPWYDFSDVFRLDKTQYSDELKWKQSEAGKEEYRKKLLAEREALIKKRIEMNLATEAEVAELGNIQQDETLIDPKDDIIAQLEARLLSQEEKPEVDAKTAVAENKELFRDLLGYKEARGEDISDMLMSASAKFLKPGATVRGGLGEFMEAESVRPSRMQKIKDAAGTLAIQDYISGKKSKEAVKLMRATEEYRPTAKLKAMMPTLDDSPQMALIKFAQINGTDNVGSERTIKDAIEFKTKQPVVRNTKIKLEDVEKPSKQKHLKIGYNIIEKDTIKYYVKWDGIKPDILTFEQIWAQE
jgi:hypothetical protein